MGSLFENAALSISALAAVDSQSGMLPERNTPSVIVHLGDIECGVRTRVDSLPQALRSAKLETRAWCYQERFLSKAVLFVGPQQMYWEGRNGAFSEVLPAHRLYPSALLAHVQPSAESSNEPSDAFASSRWLHIIKGYSSRQLTRASDILPAIAGLADRFQTRMRNDIYIQGVWSSDLHRQLLWRRKNIIHGKIIPSREKFSPHATLSLAERPRYAIASTFSWASHNDAVEYPVPIDTPVRQGYEADAVFDVIGSASRYIGAEGFLKRGACKPSTAKYCKPDEAVSRPSSSLLVDEGLACFLDYVNEPVSRGCYCLRIADWTTLSASSIKKKKAKEAGITAYLMLEKQTDEALDSRADVQISTYKRIGMGFNTSERFNKIFANAERRQLRLV